jgi:hypothetical protein
MGKLKRGGYIFVSWKGDHLPRHTHIFSNHGLVAKFDLENWKLMEGKLNKKITQSLLELRKEGKL